MYFDYHGRDGGSDSIGSTTPRPEWFLAEGYTANSPNNFDTWNLLMNPNDKTCEVDGTYMKNNGETKTIHYTIPAHARKTIKVDEVPGFECTDVSSRFTSTNGVTFLADRAMYFNYNGITDGHASVGAYRGHEFWYVADGYTAPNSDTWILIANPNTEAANVKVQFMTDTGKVVTKTYGVGPTSRFTIGIGRIRGLENVSVSTEVDVVNGTLESRRTLPVIVEGATYFNYQGIGAGCESLGIGVDIKQ